MMKTERAIYTMNIIVNPKWGVVSRTDLRPCSLFRWGIRIGKEDIFFDAIETVHIMEGCLFLSYNSNNLRFTVQSPCAQGKIVEEVNIWLRDAIIGLRYGRSTAVRCALAKLQRKDRNCKVFIAVKIFYIVILSIMFGFLFNLFDKHPKLWIAFAFAFVIGNISISVIFAFIDRCDHVLRD